ncbi:hypothetical protein [Caldibacillus thermoamylovorans]|uniref:hypothetical protein n=1 Tax=Caldibacillus thermoamylovorans TaxID=35841 RepID=UPI00203FB5B4|nr:hypothetical protein [Caldibacillus thermoamylovorans]MCM3056490.1 hypothetical protein [Caldibacillus thermoamylovorans]
MKEPLSSPYLGENLLFLTTGLFLVTFLSRKMPLFGDETTSRRHFGVKNSLFWRRDSFSSSLLLGKLHFLATRPLLVVTFGRETPLFDDETLSRRHFWARNSTFWRRDTFLVVTFAWKTPLFGDETLSRRHFCSGNSTF